MEDNNELHQFNEFVMGGWLKVHPTFRKNDKGNDVVGFFLNYYTNCIGWDKNIKIYSSKPEVIEQFKELDTNGKKVFLQVIGKIFNTMATIHLSCEEIVVLKISDEDFNEGEVPTFMKNRKGKKNGE